MNDVIQNTNPVERSFSLSKTYLRTFLTRVYLWMTLGLGITALIAFVLAQSFDANPDLVDTVSALIFPAFILELILVWVISARSEKANATVSGILFAIYSALNGLFFSIVLVAYAPGVVTIAFLSTMITFLIMSAYGYFTEQDLTSTGNIALMSLVGIIVASIINIFANSEALYWVVTYVGLVIFVILTAYDTQKLKDIAAEAEMKNISVGSIAITGALNLYLDFINLFIIILRLLDGKRD